MKGAGCANFDESEEYKDICDGSMRDCVVKGQEKCQQDEDCFGITWQDDDWIRERKGVGVCKSKKLIPKLSNDWNVVIKCASDLNGKFYIYNLNFFSNSKHHFSELCR